MTITFRGKHKTGFTVDVLSPFTFPAGEAHVKGFEDLKLDDYEYFIADIRGHDPQDLFHLAVWANGLRDKLLEDPNSGDKAMPDYYVFLPYLPAARADHGTPVAADTYAEFMNLIVMPNGVFAIDPHSQHMPSMIEMFHEVPFERIIKRVIAHPRGDQFQMDHNYAGVIAPDKGAHARATRAAAVLHVPVFTAGKTRDQITGQLSGFHMEDELPQEGKFLIVDDICDGGGTFIGLAEAIKKTNPNIELDLWVTHGIFSEGTDLLNKHFGMIHTTNSYLQVRSDDSFGWPDSPDEFWINPKTVKVHDITPYLYAEVALVEAR